MQRKHFAAMAFLAVLATAGLARAATVTYVVFTNTTVSPMTFSVYASVSSGDNAGLAEFGFDIINNASGTSADDLRFLTKSLKASYAFFGASRSSGTLTANAITGVRASQGIWYGDTNDPDADAAVVQGIGQIAVFQLMSGTFSGTIGTITLVPDSASQLVLNGQPGLWMGPGNCSAPANIVVVPAYVFPEPATLSLLALGGLALIRRRR